MSGDVRNVRQTKKANHFRALTAFRCVSDTMSGDVRVDGRLWKKLHHNWPKNGLFKMSDVRQAEYANEISK
jgi:hypothetical protein